MPFVSFGGSSSGGSWSASGHQWSDGVGLPVGRYMASGSRAVLITELYGYVGGRGAARTVRLQLGSASTGNFTVSAQSDSGGTGWYSTNHWLVQGGTARINYYSSGAVYFGHGGSGHTDHGSGSGWSGTLGGIYGWVQAPTAPHSLTLASDSPDSVTVSWSAPTDNGETGVTGYLLQYSLSSTFASGVTSLNLGASTTTTIDELDAGETYYFRVAAKNMVTTAAGSTSLYSTVASIDIASTGTVIEGIPPEFTENPGAFWSLAGHNVGFNAQAEVVPLDEAAVSFEFYDPITTDDVTSTVVVRRNAAWSTEFVVVGDNMYAQNVQGDSLLGLSNPDGTSSTQTIAFKTVLGEQGTTLGWMGGPINSNLGTGQQVSLILDPVGETIEVTADYRSAGMMTQASDTASISSLNLDEELSVYVTYQWNNTTRTYDLYASVRQSGVYVSSIPVGLNYTADGIDLYTDPWQITGNVRSLMTANLLSGAPINDLHEWENPASYQPESGLAHGGPVVSYSGNVWEYLQMAATATGCEYTLVDGVVWVLPLGERVLDVTNIVGSPTITPQSLFTGRSVEISYSNAQPVSLGAIYDAGAEGNRIFSISKNQIKTESVITNASPQTVLKPSPTGIYPNPLGTYYVIDSNDEPVSPIDWVSGGGSVSVAISPTESNVIDVTITGPLNDIPGSPGPYTIGNKINSASIGTLKVVGSGLSTNPQVLTLLTGATPEKTPQEVADSIENVFISDISMAYDRGIWASTEATNRVSLSGILPVSAVEHFGLTQGSLIRYADNIFRVTDAVVTNIDVEFSAEAYCLVSDFDAHWNELTVADHDAHWDGYESQDERIMPLR